MSKNKNILVVGAGGFAGGFHVQEALRRGYNVWAGVRHSTSRKYLAYPALKFVEFDFDKPETLAETLRSALPENEKWDYIVYNLGATKCLNFADFNRINHDYLDNFLNALKEADMMPEKFLYMSSLSALGPGDEKNYTPYKETDMPIPNTRYGASKLKAEMTLTMSGIPYIIFRATGIYGPRDKDYFLMFKSIQKGLDFSVGYRPQMLSFIYVTDLSAAIYDALEKAPLNQTYHIAEKKAYTQKEFRQMAARSLGKKHVMPLRMPLWTVRAVCAVAEKWGVVTMKPSTLNRDKFNIMKQRNWVVDCSKAVADFDFDPKVQLEEGIERSIKWYREEKWLK